MRFLKFSLIVLILSTLLSIPQPTAAKGVAHRIIISSEALADDIVVTNTNTVSWFSMARLERFWCEENALDLRCGEIEEPTDIAESYLIERQFQHGVDQFATLDKVIYYPSTTAGHRGYVFYKGIVDGSSEYDDKWYYVSSEAEIVLKRLLEIPTLHDYILVAEQNERFPNLIALIDPNTLERVITMQVDMPEGTYITAAGADATGQKLIINVDGATNGSIEIDYANWSYCSLGVREWLATSFDKKHHLFLVGHIIEIRAADTYDLVEKIAWKGNQVKFFPSGDGQYLYLFDYYSASNSSLWRINLQTFELTKITEIKDANSDWQGVANQDFLNAYLTDGEEIWVWEDYQDRWQDLGKLNLAEGALGSDYLQPVGMVNGQFSFYNQQGWYHLLPDEDLAGGIFRTQLYEGTVGETLYADIPFAQVIYNNNSFYGLSNPEGAEEAMLYRLAENSETILAEQSFAAGAHYIDYVQMDAAVLGPDVDLSECMLSYDKQISRGDIK